MDGPRSTDEDDGETATDRRWPRVGVLGALLVALALAVVVWLAAGAQRSDDITIDQAAATAIARAFFDEAHGPGASSANVRILSVALGTDSAGRPAWKVNIGGNVTEAGASSFGYSSFGYSSYMWLDVDAESGAVTLVAQG